MFYKILKVKANIHNLVFQTLSLNEFLDDKDCQENLSLLF
jgi:hypothetical protein